MARTLKSNPMNIAMFHWTAKQENIFRAVAVAKYYGVPMLVIKAWTSALLATLKN